METGSISLLYAGEYEVGFVHFFLKSPQRVIGKNTSNITLMYFIECSFMIC